MRGEPVAREADAAASRLFEAQECVEAPNELDESLVAFAGGELLLSEHERVESGASGAHSEQEAAAGDVVECREILRERHRMPEVR